jgi:hypothetical protein
MNYFGIIKVGYTAGIYGNSGEQFVAIYTSKDGLKSYSFEGQYGAESRVAEIFKKAGFKESYISSGGFGKMLRKDAKFFKSEYTAIQELPTILRLKNKKNSNGTCKHCKTKNIEYGIYNGSYWYYCHYCCEVLDKKHIV